VAVLSPEEQQAMQETCALAERTRWAGYLLACGVAFNSLFGLIVGIDIATMPWTILRRARRKAIDWQARRCAGPYYLGGSLLWLILWAVYWNLALCLFLVSRLQLAPPETDVWATYIFYGIGQSIGIGALIWLVAAIRRRRRFRSWRLHVEAVPVVPGESVAFEVRREDGRPLGAGLRLEIVGKRISWSLNPATVWKSIVPQPVPGEVQADAAANGPAPSIKGTLRIDAAGLSLAPPPGVKHPSRLFVFLRVRQGWWMKCLFEVPLPEVYSASPAE
jgi:hypothetical protein